jgi:hypothetical protein
MSGVPSGEALKTAESGLVNKAQQAMINIGNSWEDCLMMALRIQAAFGTEVADAEGTMVETTWDDPETRNEQSHMEVLKAKAELGVTKHQIYRELGYTQDQIDQMDMDNEVDRRSETNIGAEILRNFNAGEI